MPKLIVHVFPPTINFPWLLNSGIQPVTLQKVEAGSKLRNHLVNLKLPIDKERDEKLTEIDKIEESLFSNPTFSKNEALQYGKYVALLKKLFSGIQDANITFKCNTITSTDYNFQILAIGKFCLYRLHTFLFNSPHVSDGDLHTALDTLRCARALTVDLLQSPLLASNPKIGTPDELLHYQKLYEAYYSHVTAFVMNSKNMNFTKTARVILTAGKRYVSASCSKFGNFLISYADFVYGCDNYDTQVGQSIFTIREAFNGIKAFGNETVTNFVKEVLDNVENENERIYHSAVYKALDPLHEMNLKDSSNVDLNVEISMKSIKPQLKSVFQEKVDANEAEIAARLNQIQSQCAALAAKYPADSLNNLNNAFNSFNADRNLAMNCFRQAKKDDPKSELVNVITRQMNNTMYTSSDIECQYEDLKGSLSWFSTIPYDLSEIDRMLTDIMFYYHQATKEIIRKGNSSSDPVFVNVQTNALDVEKEKTFKQLEAKMKQVTDFTALVKKGEPVFNEFEKQVNDLIVKLRNCGNQFKQITELANQD